jgi:phenylalanyl-tRNA synthetase beta chain
MKVSLNWIKEYTDINFDTATLVDKIGRQIGEIEEVIDLAKRYEGIYIVKVVECIPHPQADKLSLCKVDDGHRVEGVERDDKGLIQIVCGAPNVMAGMKAVWLPPGTTVPSTAAKDPFVLEPKEIRGQLSNGMMASPKELGVGESHAGLLEISDDAGVGQPFSEFFGLNDIIIDIENKMLTHRPDLFGQLGIAREVAGISGKPFKSPDWYLKVKDLNLSRGSNSIEVKNEIPDLVARFMTQVITGVTIKPSSPKIQSYLNRVGMRPINNVVDLTNYFMMLTAQPLHAYDLDKLKALDGADKATIIVRNAREEEELTLLSGKTIKLNTADILISSADRPIGLGGVMGGADAEVDDTTKNIVIECASFDMYAIRRTAMRHGVFSDAVTRFNKGQSPLQNDRVLAEIVSEVIEQAGGEAEAPIDIQATLPRQVQITVSVDLINNLLGLSLSADKMVGLLKNVEFEVMLNNNELNLTVPFWRTDIHIAEDVVEEIGRLNGYDQLALELPKKSIKVSQKNKLFSFKTEIRDLLVRGGANEVLTYSFVPAQLIEKVGQNQELAYQLTNAIRPELQFYRLSLLPGLLDKVHPNIKAGFQEFALFELNKVHVRNVQDEAEPNLPAEIYRLAMVISADSKIAKADYAGAAYYQAKFYLDYLLYGLGIQYEIKALDHELSNDAEKQLVKPFEPIRSGLVEVGGDFIGVIGEPNASVKNNLKLPDFTSMIELDLGKLLNLAKPLSYTKLSNYPFVEQDVCFKVPSDLSYQALSDLLNDELTKLVSNSHVSLSPLDVFQRDDDKSHKQTTFRLRISSYETTLKSNEVNELINSLGTIAKERFGAEII